MLRPSTARSARPRPRSLLASTALLLVLSGVGVVAAASEAAAAVNSFAFSGSLSGTLKLVTADDCGGSAGGETQLDDIAGKLKGSKTDQYTIIVIAPKNGTFKIKPSSSGATSTVTLETPGKNEALSWDATKGSITVKGDAGSINVTMKGTTGGASGTLKIKGSWSCPS